MERIDDFTGDLKLSELTKRYAPSDPIAFLKKVHEDDNKRLMDERRTYARLRKKDTISKEDFAKMFAFYWDLYGGKISSTYEMKKEFYFDIFNEYKRKDIANAFKQHACKKGYSCNSFPKPGQLLEFLK